jgi:hypothetical protein
MVIIRLSSIQENYHLVRKAPILYLQHYKKEGVS